MKVKIPIPMCVAAHTSKGTSIGMNLWSLKYNFVAFSEYMNFKYSKLKHHSSLYPSKMKVKSPIPMCAAAHTSGSTSVGMNFWSLK